MFRRIRQWWLNRGRDIYRYWDGERFRVADPLVVYRALDEDPEYDQDKHLPLLRMDDAEALQICLRATRRAFGVKPFDQGGLTEGETVGLLYGFIVYVDDVKKNFSPPQILPPLTDQAPLAESDTKHFSDCSSTGTGQPTEELPVS